MTLEDKNGRYLSMPLGSGKTFFDISINTDKISMGIEAYTLENDSNMPILSDFRTKIWLKSY